MSAKRHPTGRNLLCSCQYLAVCWLELVAQCLPRVLEMESTARWRVFVYRLSLQQVGMMVSRGGYSNRLEYFREWWFDWTGFMNNPDYIETLIQTTVIPFSIPEENDVTARDTLQRFSLWLFNATLPVGEEFLPLTLTNYPVTPQSISIHRSKPPTTVRRGEGGEKKSSKQVRKTGWTQSLDTSSAGAGQLQKWWTLLAAGTDGRRRRSQQDWLSFIDHLCRADGVVVHQPLGDSSELWSWCCREVELLEGSSDVSENMTNVIKI